MIAILVDRTGEKPIYEQIAEQIRDSISTGALPPGTSLPSVRTLASDLGVNLNTVARAYRLLEEEGFVRIRKRAGVIVAEPANRASADVRERLERDLRRVIDRMRQMGIPQKDLERLIRRGDGARRPPRGRTGG